MNIQERIEALETEFAGKIKALKAEAQREQEFPRDGDDYWYVDDDAEVMEMEWDGSDYDQDRLSIDNVFRTKEEAEFAAEKLKIEAELRKFSKPFGLDSLTFTICFDVEENELYSETSRFMSQGSIYFGRSQAEEAMDAVGRERIKKYIFGVED